MYKNKYIRTALWVLAFLLCIGCYGALSYAKEDVIVVGYTEKNQMIHKHDSDKLYGYGVAYLAALERYGNFSFEYVLLSEEERLEKLQDGSIDLLCDVPKNEDLEKKLAYSSQSSSVDYGLLYVSGDNTDIFYEEYPAMNGCRVGIDVNDTIPESLLDAYAEAHNISFDKAYYDNMELMTEALQNQEIDMMYASNLRIVTAVKQVAKVGMEEIYFATSMDKQELMDELSKAQNALYEDSPQFDAMLYTQYSGKHRDGLNGITRLEYNFIQTTRPIRVAVLADNYPIEYFNEETGEYSGVEPAILSLIKEKNGLPFEYVTVTSAENAIEKLEAGEIDMVSGFYVNEVSRGQYKFEVTEPYLSLDYTVLSSDSYAGTAEIQTIALPKEAMVVRYYIMEEHPEWEIIYKDNIQACIQAVTDGAADVTVVNSIRLQTNYSTEDLKKVKILTTEAISMKLSYAVRKNMSPVFISIMDKTIHSIPEEQFKACITKNSVSMVTAVTMKDMAVKFGPYLLSAVGVMLAVFFFIIRQRELRYKKLATEDAVSGLWTGFKFRKEATTLLNRNRHIEYYLISLDIDKFKNMNNNLGAKTADRILSVIGRRLRELFKDKALYARDMADMFFVMTEKCDNLEEKLESLSKEVYINQNGKKYYYSLVIKFGVTLIEERDTIELIEKYVNQAISARKSIKGKVGVDIAFYDEKMKQEYLREELIEQKMNQALEDREFVVYYQPKYDLETEKLTGAEALVRWKKPDGGLVPPNHFIPLFEKNGFIINLDFYVFEEVMRDIAEWIKQGKKIVPISVNVSRLHIGMPGFLDRMLELTEKYNISSSLVELELTESVMSDDSNNIQAFLIKCRNAGFKLSIDDFGSGYSSLNLLKGMPFDVLKIDKEFLNETEDSERSRIIVEQVIQMAKRIHIDTLCEGVETREQADFLKKIGCHMVQGFLFSRPLPHDDFDKLL